MMRWFLALFPLVVWVVCMPLAYAMTLYDFERKFPAFGHMRFAIAAGCTGPIGLVVALICSSSYGLRWRPLTREQKWEEHKRRWPNLSYEEFLKTL